MNQYGDWACACEILNNLTLTFIPLNGRQLAYAFYPPVGGGRFHLFDQVAGNSYLLSRRSHNLLLSFIFFAKNLLLSGESVKVALITPSSPAKLM